MQTKARFLSEIQTNTTVKAKQQDEWKNALEVKTFQLLRTNRFLVLNKFTYNF